MDLCAAMFAADPTKAFSLVGDYRGESADLGLPLDVIYHLVEDHIFEDCMRLLFGAATRFVIIYASNCEKSAPAPHVRHRLFTEKVAKDYPE